MGVKHTKSKDLLDGSEWLRSVVQHYQKRRHGVAGFESFAIEPVVTRPQLESPCAKRKTTSKNDIVESSENGHKNGSRSRSKLGDLDDNGDGIEEERVAGSAVSNSYHAKDVSSVSSGVRHMRVSISFRNGKNQSQKVNWIVKSAQGSVEAVDALLHEIKVYTTLLGDVHKFLNSHKNVRARYLLNIPDYVFQERRYEGGRVTRCHLVLEDISQTKRCSPIENLQWQQGLTMGQFKVFLGTLAQFHAVGVAWNLATKDDSTLDNYPFLHYDHINSISPAERERLFRMYERLLKWKESQNTHKSQKHSFKRRLKLFHELRHSSTDLLAINLQKDMCDPLGGLCLGNVLPYEVMFQYHKPVSSIFEFSKPTDLLANAASGGVGANATGPTAPVSATVSYDENGPICAAVNTCHRVYFGNLVRELANLVFTAANPNVRRDYLIFMLQSYAFVLTSTLDLLDVAWSKHFKMSFPQFVRRFYDFVPQAILQSILIHMQLTNSAELDHLIFGKGKSPRNSAGNCGSGNLSSTAESNKSGCGKNENASKLEECVPLTPERIEFLIRLTDLVHKPI